MVTVMSFYANISDILKYKDLNILDIEYLMPLALKLCKNELLECIVLHPLVTIEWMNKQAHVNWTYLDNIMQNPYVTKENIKKYPSFGWKWHNMHKLRDLDSNFVLSNKYENWNWHHLSAIMDFSFVLQHPKLNWDPDYLSVNPSIKLKEVGLHPEINWNLSNLIEGPIIKKDLEVNTLLNYITESKDNDIFENILKMFIYRFIPITEKLIKQMKPFPWFFKRNSKLARYNFEQIHMLNPATINDLRLIDFSIPIELINEKVSNFYDKIETEVANVVATKINLGCETNCGIRQHIRMFL
jgi:hypothetical protein